MGKEINAGKQNLLLFTPATFSKKKEEKYLFTYHLILLTVNSVNLQILLSFSQVDLIGLNNFLRSVIHAIPFAKQS